MKVLHLIDHLGLGGAQTSLVDLLEVRGAGIDASVCSLRDGAYPHLVSRLQRCGVSVRSLGLSKGSALGLGALRALVKSERPDVVHTHLEYSTTFGGATALTLGSARPSVVAGIVNDPAGRHALLHRMAGWVLAPHVDAHIALSPSIAQAIDVAYGGRSRRVAVIPPGVNVSYFSDGRVDEWSVARLRYGARHVVGTVGRLAAQKAVHVLLDAMPRLLASQADTRLLIVGDGPLRGDLEARARALGVAQSVTFAGYLSDVRPAYRAMDVFVLPSRDEGFGIVFLEAMLMGVPVVGTRVIGSVDAVEDGVTGMLVSYDDAPALANAVLRVFGDASLARRLSTSAAERARTRFSRERMAASVESLYRDIRRPRAVGRQ